MTERMWRVVAVYRVVTMIYAAALIIRDHDQYAHPAGGIAILAVIIFWTSVTVVAYSRPGGRQRWLIVADVIVTAALVYSTRWVDTPSRIAHGFPTLPSFWAASPVLACAVAFGPWMGITAALVISGSDYAERPQLSLEILFSNIVLLLIAGGIGGYIVRLGLQAEEAVARVARKEAAIAERERLARDIHDSVLQVLTRVSSRGRALGGGGGGAWSYGGGAGIGLALADHRDRTWADGESGRDCEGRRAQPGLAGRRGRRCADGEQRDGRSHADHGRFRGRGRSRQADGPNADRSQPRGRGCPHGARDKRSRERHHRQLRRLGRDWRH